MDIKDELPEWCAISRLQIDSVGTASALGFKDDSINIQNPTGIGADLKFLIERPANMMLVEQAGTRQDGAWFFDDPCYAGSLAIKLYSKSIPKAEHKSNETSSDIRLSFLKKDGARKNRNLKKYRNAFVKSKVPEDIKGMLRIHIEIPRASGVETTTRVRGNDIMVYINVSNLDDFFYEGKLENKCEMDSLKNILKYITK
ncbi:hypothetical protein BGZ76_010815 [Entomortierella beljakovae]|nr:hypothetical protein BGZ76_010815 [Entomortierella beljakovae]